MCNKWLLLSDWMEMVMENGKADDDNVCSMATVLENGDGKSDVLSDNNMTTTCRPPVIHLARLDDKIRSSSHLLNDGWWMADENMIRATQSMSWAWAIII